MVLSNNNCFNGINTKKTNLSQVRSGFGRMNALLFASLLLLCACIAS